MNYEIVTRTTEGLVASGLTSIQSIAISPLTATPTAGLLTVYDGTTEAGKVLYNEWVFATAPGHSIELEAVCNNGIYVGFDATLANISVTVTFGR